MRKRLVMTMVGFMAAFGITFTSSPAMAADKTFNTLSGWDTSDTRTAGHAEVTDEGLHVYTDDATSQAKVAAYYPAPDGLSVKNVGEPSLIWVGTDPAPGLQLVVDIAGGTGYDGILVGEKVYGNDWWLSNSASAAMKALAPKTTGGSGSQWHGTLAEWAQSAEDKGVGGIWITKVGFSLGSGVKGDGLIKSMKFGSDTYKFNLFEAKTEDPTVTDATCDEPGRLNLPKDTDAIDYVASAPQSGGKVTVNAVAKEGYKLTGKTQWELTIPGKLAANNCVVPEKPQSWDPTCDTGPKYQADTEQVTYDHEGLPSGAGFYTVKATPKEGFKFKEGVTTEWRIDYKIPTGCDSTPTPNPSQSGGTGGGETPGSPAPSTSTSNAAGELPVTGPSGGPAKLIGLFGTGLLMVAVGGLGLVWARRRRDADAVESA